MINFMFRHLLICCVVLLINCGVFSIASASHALDKIVAVVNNEIITQSQLEQRTREMQQQLTANRVPVPPMKELRKIALNNLIDMALQLQLAKTMGITIDDEGVTKAINSIAKQNHLSVDQLRAELQKEGISYSNYRKEIQKQIILSQLQEREVGTSIKISDQEVTDLMASMKNQPSAARSVSGEYHLQAILVPVPENPTIDQIQTAQKLADGIMAKLKTGADFIQTASSNPTLQSGDLGWRKVSELPSLFAQQLQGVSAGGLIGPLRAPNGFHILKLVEKRGGRSISPVTNNKESMREQAKQIIYRRKFEEGLRNWLQQVRSTAYIKSMDGSR